MEKYCWKNKLSALWALDHICTLPLIFLSVSHMDATENFIWGFLINVNDLWVVLVHFKAMLFMAWEYPAAFLLKKFTRENKNWTQIQAEGRAGSVPDLNQSSIK